MLKQKTTTNKIKKYLQFLLLVFFVANFALFIQIETFILLKVVLTFLSIWFLALFFKNDWDFLIILENFLLATILFYFLDTGLLSHVWAYLIFVVLSLFYFFAIHWNKSEIDDYKKHIIYIGLLSLLMTEAFAFLKFLPIDSKNRAIILVLIFWYFDQIYFYYRAKTINKMIVFNLTAIFLIIFVIIISTLELLGR
ncbi:MAG: hypothetical protein CEN89_475 [Candidatus Berkelbacteria bacterium Licking1014_7]|uniref:Uncharacterized protein n=1 Tax=Candidatus Berkelbacteria bacterium Licking1014_7 TaxID=2017147 RepID=A0A554LIR6_9BACT|nr:MAG: hypothetical protein CEN89_475 [Candidatus Berkelbacteria bacterium Licking1014_7]